MRAHSLADLEFATIEQLQPLLAKRKISPVELTNLYLSRIECLDPRLNAFRTVTPERALADARLAEREIMRGRHRGPLHGIPLALKDNIYTQGVRTTAGSGILRDFVPESDAAVVERLRRAGAVLLGKTNMHEFAYGITSENPHYGPTRNPWLTDRISGGSSGGSAAAIAAGLCAGSIGTDTGGSIRVPAALCGIVGLKPTFGRVSVRGVFPLAPSFDHVGPLARTATDAALLLAAVAGHDPRDPYSAVRPRLNLQPLLDARRLGESRLGKRRLSERRRAQPKKMQLKEIRLGRPKEYFWTRLDPEVRQLTEAALAWFAERGAIVEDVSLPTMEEAAEASNIVALVEAREVHESAGYFPARAHEYGDDVRQRLELGGGVRGVDYVAARKTLRLATMEFGQALYEPDALHGEAPRKVAIVTLTVPIAAPPIGAERTRVGNGNDNVEEPVRAALLRLNRPANFTGLPAISVPCGFTRAGLPVAIQLTGRAFDEAAILRIAQLYEQAHDWRSVHPKLD